jgi:hypothetical protein
MMHTLPAPTEALIAVLPFCFTPEKPRTRLKTQHYEGWRDITKTIKCHIGR